MREITLDYAAGVLENLGGFYVFNNKKRKAVHPKFKIVCSKEKADLITEILVFLQKYKIFFSAHQRGETVIFTASRFEILEKLIIFLDKNCRLKKTNQDVVKTILNDRKKLQEDIKAKKMKVYDKMVNGNGNNETENN